MALEARRRPSPNATRCSGEEADWPEEVAELVRFELQ
jgi:hypothetical protein